MAAPEDERVENPCSYMAHLAEAFLPLKKWGFKESYRSDKSGDLIYDSEWCRVNFVWGGWEMYTGNTMSIYYGRLHAPSDKARMIWNGEECRCWHDFSGTGAVLDFLDGLTPQESAAQKGFPKVIEQFRQSEIWQNLAGERRQPELAVRMDAAIWEHYGLRLFELFDLRRPDLWEQYRQYMKEICDIKGRGPKIGPSLDLDKIC